MPSILRRPWFIVCLALLWLVHLSHATAGDPPPQKAEMAGYLLVPHGKVPEKYNAGFSMYVAAWPLLEELPGAGVPERVVRYLDVLPVRRAEAREGHTPTSRAGSAGGMTRGSPPRRRSSSWAAWP